MKMKQRSILDFFQKIISLLKLPFLISLRSNFSTICSDMLSKFAHKSLQKSSILTRKASFERSLLLSTVTLITCHQLLMADDGVILDEYRFKDNHDEKYHNKKALEHSKVEAKVTNFPFENFPKKRKIFWSRKRLAQKYPNIFEMQNTFVIDKKGNIKDSQGNIYPAITELPDRYLPGEKVTHRFSTTTEGVISEISYTPQPVKAVSNFGELVAEATLEKTHPTTYSIQVHAKGGFHIKSDKDNKTHYFEHPSVLTYTPQEAGKKGGEGKVSILLNDGTAHTMKLPWGEAFIPYLKGEKKSP